MKRILIAGAHSYIGESLKEYLEAYPDQYAVDVISTKGLRPSSDLFEGCDVVFCAAGIAHIRETSQNRDLFFEINRDLVTEIAKAAKAAGVRQFILLSSMSVYGLLEGRISKSTLPHPNSAYGESKLQADEEISTLEDEHFIFTCLRPPMVYGKNCRGNYQALRKFALKSPLFPDYENERSMIYIGNLCEFVKTTIDLEKGGLFFPQNDAYVCTSRMVQQAAERNGKKIRLTRAFNRVLKRLPGSTVKKVFGSLTYEPVDRVSKFSFSESMRLTEGE